METLDPLGVRALMAAYADKHNIFHLMETLLSSLVVDQPEDPISYLIYLLKRTNLDVPRVLVLGPPSVGKHTVARRLSAELRAVHVTTDALLVDQSELSTQQVQQRLSEVDCLNRGWVLEGFPQTRLQALSLKEAGLLPQHVVFLEAPDEVLDQRSLGKVVDPLTGDVYHQTFIWPQDTAVAERLEAELRPSEEQRLAELQRYRREVTGLRSAYQHVLRVVNSDQPHADVYQQVLAFVRTCHRSRTPRILLLGPPASGKSHQARLLSERHRMVDVCCEELLWSAAAVGSDQGNQIQFYLDQERPVPDSLVMQVLEERLNRLDCADRGWILHGVPPGLDLQQARSLQDTYEPRVFFLDLTEEVCLKRISLRRQRLHALTGPQTSEVQTRPEDHISLSQYLKQSAGLQCVFPDAVHIDADQDPHCVFEALESRLTSD